MPVKTTVLRLERQIREENLRALETTRLEWERLAREVVAAARRRGFAGDDPYLALQTLCVQDPESRRLALNVGELWLTFFGCLDPSGGGAITRFRGEADELNKRLAKAVPGEGPDPALAADVLETLDAFWREHQAQVGERLARLAESSGARATQELSAALGQERERRERAEADARATVESLAAFLAAIGAAIEGRQSKPLPGRAEALVEAVRRVGEARAELAQQVAELRAQVTQLSGERRELMEELKARDTALARHEAGEVAEFELDAGAAAGALKACDRHLDQLVRHLAELRAIVPLSDDPRRYRPRLFGGEYELKTLPGQAAALRDAARDLLCYADRARWALGVTRLGKASSRLGSVFQELVRLIAAWRSKLGDPPPVSATMAIRAADSVCALPAVAAADVEALLKRRGAGDKAAAELASVLEPCAALLSRTLAEARGMAPPRTEAGKRETAKGAASRLAGELADLAGQLEAAFSEAVAADFRLPAAEARLLAEEQLLRLAVQQLDGACAEFAQLPGAPESKLAPPAGRGDLDGTLQAARSRADWLERVAASRFRVA
jgi:hypothetical protein